MADEPREGDQPLPVPNDGPSMHDLVIEDLAKCLAPSRQKDAACALLLERKRIGLERYNSLLQAGNGRNWHRDLTEELGDAAVYARQGRVELEVETELDEIYWSILHLLCRVAEHEARRSAS
jgi:hypothetical protein